MPQRSAGIVLYRRGETGGIEVLLVHPGGPYWAKKDDGAWSIPKGLVAPGEDPLLAARREFAEETGGEAGGDAIALGEFRQSAAKTVAVWAVEGEFDPAALRSISFSMEWPPRSGRSAEFPEADRAGWFTPEVAERKLLKGQRQIVEALLRHLGLGGRGS